MSTPNGGSTDSSDPSALTQLAGSTRRDDLPNTRDLQNAIFNSTNFSSIATDANGVIQIFNVGAEHMLGYAAGDVMNKVTPADISDPQELILRARALSLEFATPITPGFEALVFKASREIEDIYELTYIRKDGSRFPAVVSVTALRDAHNAVIGYLLIGTDNTARKQAEEARQEMNSQLKRAKLVAEKANLAKSDFLSSMSHELRSPLNAILGFAQLMDSGVPSPTPSQRESIEQILQAGWYLLELINEILDLSLIESGNLSLSPESMSLADVLEDCHAMIEPLANKGGIALKFPRFEEPSFVKADRTRVKQIFVNLLSNAIKYNRDGGVVEVICSSTSPERTRISFQDSGEGLSPEKLAQLFQPFNRLGQEAGAEEGTGIGLVVSKRLVELMGGEIGAQSIVGQGSNFWVEFNSSPGPRLVSEQSEASIQVSPRVDAKAPKYTLLCVEDNPANLMLIERLLDRRTDIQLLTAKDGTHGIEIARAVKPAVILMDINLPGISGVEALKILSVDPGTKSIPVIALSANAMPHDIQKGLEIGFFRYLTKPIKVDQFMETLDVALNVSNTGSSNAYIGDIA
jgi:signal transduction histidine kinase/ActR/RegA family two-component response regulator